MQANRKAEIREKLKEKCLSGPQDWVDIHVSTSGLLNLTVVSQYFQGHSFAQRQEEIVKLLSDDQSTLSFGFLSLYTPEEAETIQLQSSAQREPEPIRTWQDLALWAVDAESRSLNRESREGQLPRTITFYSYKGGVGRTTALTHVAWILAMRGRKVVAVDLDVEAPGLSTAFNLSPGPKYGIVDYFYERAYAPEDIEYEVSITQIFGEVKIPNATGRLFVVPAGSLTLDYIAKIDDLRAATVLNGGEDLWSMFQKEIFEQLKPDILLVDSRTGINQWGALSLLRAADEVIIFLFPNEQNQEGIDLLIQSLQSLQGLSLNFVFTPVPDTTAVGMAKVKEVWAQLQARLNDLASENGNAVNLEGVGETDGELNGKEDILSQDSSDDVDDFLIVPYLAPIALAERYPVPGLLDYYTRIANILDEETDELQRSKILTGSDQRWRIIESLSFPEVNASDPAQKLDLIFQRTADFENFLDNTTCLIRGRKGTGKTALYWLLLKHFEIARELAYGRLETIQCFSGHGRFDESRPSREEFQVIHQSLQREQGSWEAFWRSYLLMRAAQRRVIKFPRSQKGEKFDGLKAVLNQVSGEGWQYEHTQALIRLSTDSELVLVAKDALDLLDAGFGRENRTAWFLYDDLDEDFPQRDEVRSQALTGLFRFIQSCDSRNIRSLRFKIFLREDIWHRLVFDNKSHFNGRDLLLQWTRIDFLKLALRQALQSAEFKGLVNRFSPIESIDQASEEAIDRALALLWGSRRRRGSKAKYVSRWVYERLTDASHTTFPRSLSILLEGARTHELSYRNQPSVQVPSDRLLRSRSLEVGLRQASAERCQAIREEYPDLVNFLDRLKGVSALTEATVLRQIWAAAAQDVISPFEDFVAFLSEVGILEWRPKDQRYRFADIYVYGFELSRPGAI